MCSPLSGPALCLLRRICAVSGNVAKSSFGRNDKLSTEMSIILIILIFEKKLAAKFLEFIIFSVGDLQPFVGILSEM